MAGLRAEVVLSVNDTQAKRSMERSAAELNRIMGGVGKQQVNFKVNSRSFTQPLGRITGSANEFTKSLEASNARVIAFGASVGIINGISDAFKNLVGETIKFEKTLADVNVVLDASNASLQKFGQGLFDVAKNTSQSFGVAAEAALEFSRQGLTMEEVLKRTNDALTLTRLTGLKAAEAVSGLTAAVNAFSAVGLTTTQVIDKLAAVDVKFAVSSEDLINALERTGAVAIDAGVELDSLIGLVTSLQQTTARGGAVIGNGLKTIFTRIQRPKSLEQIENLNIAVRNLSGAVLPADKILINMAKSFDTLTSSQKSNVVQFSAGIFQANVFRAALRDLAKNQSIQSQATQVSAGAAGEAAMKNEKLNKTIAALASQSGTAIQELASAMGDLMVKPEIGGFLEFFKDSIEGMRDMLGGGEEQGSTFAKGLVAGIGNIITGPAAIAFGAVFIKLFMNIAKFAQGSLKDVLDIVTRKDKIKKIEESILETLSKNKDIQESLNNLDGDREQQGKFILKVIEAQTNAMREQEKLAAQLARPLLDAGVRTDLTVGGKGPVDLDGDGIADTFGAGGVLPSSARKERREAARGGYSAGAVDSMSIAGVGKVVYNRAETVKQFPGMKQPAVMPPKQSRAGAAYQDAFSQKHGFDPYASGGYVPNFAALSGGALRLNQSKMHLYANPREAKPGGDTVRNAMKALVDSGKPVTVSATTDKLLKGEGGSHTKAIKGLIRFIADQEDGPKTFERDFKLTNLPWKGNKGEDASEDAVAKALNKGGNKYINTGKRPGAHGDKTFPVDLIGAGLDPVEVKSGEWQQPNILLKSMRLYSDDELMQFAERQYGATPEMLKGARMEKLGKSARLLQGKGLLDKDANSKEQHEAALKYGISGGLIPNFNSKDSLQVLSKHDKGTRRNSGGFVPSFAGGHGGDRRTGVLGANWEEALGSIKSWVAANGGTAPDMATLEAETGKSRRKFQAVARGHEGDSTFRAARGQLGLPKLKILQDYIAKASKGATKGENMTPADISIWASKVKLKDAGTSTPNLSGAEISAVFPGTVTGQGDAFAGPGLTPPEKLTGKDLTNFKQATFRGQIDKKGLGKNKTGAIADARKLLGKTITPGWKDWEDLLAQKGYLGNNPNFPKSPLDFTSPKGEAKWGAAEDKLIPAQIIGKLLRHQVGSGNFPGWNPKTSSAFKSPAQGAFNIGSVDLLSVPKAAQGLVPNFAGDTTLYRGTGPKYQKAVPDRPNAPQFLFDKLLNAKTKAEFMMAVEELGIQHSQGQYSGSYNADLKPATLEQMRGGEELGAGEVQHAGYVYKRPTKGGRPRYASDGTTMPSGFVSKTKDHDVADRFSRAIEFQHTSNHNLQGQIHEDQVPNSRILNEEALGKIVDRVGLGRVQKGFKRMMKKGTLKALYLDLDKWKPKTEEGERRRSYDDDHNYRSIGQSGEGMTFNEQEVVQIWDKHSPFYGAGKGLIPNFADNRNRKQKISDVLGDPSNAGINFKGGALKPRSIKSKNMFQKTWLESYFKTGLEGDYQMLMKMGYDPDTLLSLRSHAKKGGEVDILGKGFVPNFANPLKEAIAREAGAGIPKSQIKVEQSGQLRGPGNPMGLAVTNKRDEPLGVGQGIRRARSMGIDPRGHGAEKIVRTKAARGVVPNFAPSSGVEIDVPLDILKLFNEDLKEMGDVLESNVAVKMDKAVATFESFSSATPKLAKALRGEGSSESVEERKKEAQKELSERKKRPEDKQDKEWIKRAEKYVQELGELAAAMKAKESAATQHSVKAVVGDAKVIGTAKKLETQKMKELGGATKETRDGLKGIVEGLQDFQEALHESEGTAKEENHERSGGLQKLFYMQAAISMTNGFLEQFSEGARGATKTFLDLASAATSVTAAYIQQKEFVNQGMEMTGVGQNERGFSLLGGNEEAKSQAAVTEAKIRGENLSSRGGKGLGNIGKVGATIGKLGRTFGRFLPIVGQLYTGFTMVNEAVKFFSKAFDLSAFGLEKGEGIMDLFASASDRATKRMEELSKTADSLKAALGGLETQEKEQIELRKLENKGTSRTIAEEKKYYDLRLKSIDTDIALSKAMGELMDENKTGRRSLERVNRVIGDTTLSMSEQKEGIRDLIIANQMLMAATSQRTLFQEGIERADSDDDSARLLALGDTRGVQMGLAMGAAFEGKKGAKPGEKIAALSHNIKELEKAIAFRGGDAKGGLKNLNFDTSEAVGSTGITEMLRGAIQDIDEFQWNTGGLSDAESKAYKKSIQELINMLKKRKDAQSDGAKDDVDIRIASLKALKFALFNIEQERKRAKHTSEMILADRLHSSKLLSIKLGIEKEYEGISNQAHIELEAARAANDRQAKYQHDLKDARRNSIDALDKIVGKDLSDPGKLSQDVMTGLKSASHAEVAQALGEFQKRINASANFSGPLTIGSSPMTRTERQNVSGAFTAASGAASGGDAVMKLKALTEARKDLTAREQVAMASIMHKEGIISLEDEKRRLMTAELQKLEIILDKTDQEKGRADELAKHETTKNLIAGKTVTGAQELYNRLIKGKDAAAIKEKLSGVINENLQGEADTLVVINEQQKSRLSIINGNLQFDRKAYETQVAKNRTESESALLALRQLEYQAMSLEGSNETRVIQEAKLRSEVITAGLSANEAELRHEFLSVLGHRVDLVGAQIREEMSGLRTAEMLNRDKLKMKIVSGDLEEAAELELREQETSLSTEALKNAHLAANLSHLKESGSLTYMSNRLMEKSNKLIEAQNASRQAVLSRGDLAFNAKANSITERSGAIGETRGAAMRALMPNASPEDLLAFANSLEETNKQLDNGSRALDRLRSKMAEIEVSAANLGADLVELGFDGVRTGFKQLLEDIGSGAKSTGDAWRDFGLGLAKTLLDRITEHNIDRIVKDLTYAFTGVDPMSEAEKIASSNNHLVTANDRLIAALKSLEDEVARDKEVLKDKVLGTPSPDGTFNGIIEPPSTLGNINIPGLISGATPSGATPGGSGWSQRGGVWTNRLNPPSVRSIPSLPAAGPPPTRPAAPTAPAQSVAALQLTAEEDYQLEIAKELKRNEGLVKDWDWVGPYKGTKRVDRKEVPVTTPATFQQNPSWGRRSPHRIGRDKDLRTQGAYQTLMDQGDTSNFPMNTGVKPRQVKDAQVAMRTQISALEYDLGKATKEKEAYQKEEDIAELHVRHGQKASKILRKIARIKEELREKREIEEAIDALPEGRRALSESKSQVHLMENPAPQLLSSPIDTTIIDPFNAPGAESTTSDLEKTKEKLAGILAIDPQLFENKVPYLTPEEQKAEFNRENDRALQELLKEPSPTAGQTTIDSAATTVRGPITLDPQEPNPKAAAIKTTGDVNATGDVKTGPVTLNVTTAGKQGGGIIQHFADGGYVKGPGGKDKVPAMLTAGEFVVPKKEMDNVQKFNGGGLAGSNPQKKLWENDPEKPKGRAQRGVEGGLQAWAMIETANYMNKALNKDVDKPPTFNMKKLDSLDLGSDVSMKRGDPRLSAKFLARDPVMQEYRDYLIEAANYKTQKKNEEFREDMGTLSSIFSAVTSFVAAELIAIAAPYVQKAVSKTTDYFKGDLGLGKHSGAYQDLKDRGFEPNYSDVSESLESGENLVVYKNKGEPNESQYAFRPYNKNSSAKGADNYPNALEFMPHRSQIHGRQRRAPTRPGAAAFNKHGVSNFNPRNPFDLQQSRGLTTIKTKNSQGGGSIPAMLTAGEGYIPAPIAKRIGYNNLSHMNNTGSMPIVKGTGGVDNVGPVGLDSGDFIMKKSSTNKLLRDNPNAMRFSLQGQSDGRRGAQGYYEGGVVGSELTVPARSLGPQKSPQGNRLQLLDQKESEKSDSGAAGSTTNAETTNNININISIDKAGAEVESQEGGEDSYEKERNLSMKIKGAVLEVIREEKRIGGELS